MDFRLAMATCESTRTRAYDPDLRWQMVYQRLVLNLPFKTISQNLCVDISTVRRTLHLFRDTNSVNKQLYPEQHARQRNVDFSIHADFLGLIT